jgi:hypothetical protein
MWYSMRYWPLSEEIGVGSNWIGMGWDGNEGKHL